MAGSPSPETAKHRARVAGITLKRGADDPEVEMARRDLEVSKLADHIQRVLAQAPPLTRQQRSKLAELLRPVRRALKAATIAETHATVIAKRTQLLGEETVQAIAESAAEATPLSEDREDTIRSAFRVTPPHIPKAIRQKGGGRAS